MNFFTVTASTYEEAVLKAQRQYGNTIRVFSKKDIITKKPPFFLTKQTVCEITCYLTNDSKKSEFLSSDDYKQFEKEARTPSPDANLSEAQELYLRNLLERNDFTSYFIDSVINKINQGDSCINHNNSELEAALIDVIIKLISFDYTTQVEPAKNFIIVGPTGVGKTTTLAKIASSYSKNKKIAIVTIDTYRVGAYEQIKNYGDQMGISVSKAETEKELYRESLINSDKDILFIDTMGKSPNDMNLELHMKKLLSSLNSDETNAYLALAASMKVQDIESSYKRFSTYGIKSLIVTKLDESETIGNIISFSYEHKLPLLFLTTGQSVPKDIEDANSTNLLKYFKGTQIDLTKVIESQLDKSSF